MWKCCPLSRQNLSSGYSQVRRLKKYPIRPLFIFHIDVIIETESNYFQLEAVDIADHSKFIWLFEKKSKPNKNRFAREWIAQAALIRMGQHHLECTNRRSVLSLSLVLFMNGIETLQSTRIWNEARPFWLHTWMNVCIESYWLPSLS